jgi:hypothetical protein
MITLTNLMVALDKKLLHIYTSIHTLPRCLSVFIVIQLPPLSIILPDTIDQRASAIRFPTKGQMFSSHPARSLGLQEWCDEWATGVFYIWRAWYN